MKNLIAVVVGSIVISSIAVAAPRTSRPGTERPIVYSRAATESVSSSNLSVGRVGVGAATYGFSAPTGQGGGASVWVNFNEYHSVQALFSVVGTAGTFQFNSGGIYRWTLSGNQSNGFHIGAGALLGTFAAATGAEFVINMTPVAGLHFSVPSVNNIMFSADAGPNFQIADGNFNFQAGAASTLLGLAVHYFF